MFENIYLIKFKILLLSIFFTCISCLNNTNESHRDNFPNSELEEESKKLEVSSEDSGNEFFGEELLVSENSEENLNIGDFGDCNLNIESLQHCSSIFIKPNLSINYIDNRKLCYCCSERYCMADYNEVSAEDMILREIFYLGAKLNLHLKQINASEEHAKEDRIKLGEFMLSTYGEDYIISVASSIGGSPISSILQSFGTDVDQNYVDNACNFDRYKNLSRYCSVRCKNDPRCP